MEEKNCVNGKLRRSICLLIMFVFMVTSVITPVYGVVEDQSEVQPEENAAAQSEQQLETQMEIQPEEQTEVQVEQQPENQSEGQIEDQAEASSIEYEEIADSWRYENGQQKEDVSEEGFSPDGGMMVYNRRAAFVPWGEVNGGFVNSKGELIQGAVKKGIDVSEFQGDINWSKVKADGIDFAIIRCGYGSDYTKQDDSKWLRNVKECERLGIPYGVYLYSYANTEAKAKSEAAHTLRLLKAAGADPDYPVYYDLEDKTVSAAGRTAIIKYAEIYCKAIEAAGYDAGIYANLNWWNNKLNSSSLDKYDRWVAQWNTTCDYKGKYRLWQCTSSGAVDGIDGRVDLNFDFQKEEEKKEEPKPITAGWIKNSKGQTVYQYSDGTIAKSKWLTLSGKKYYVGSSGTKLTGLQTIKGYKYYFNSSGVMQTGLLTVSGSKYYFNSSGVMQKSKWITVSSKKYYLGSDGKAYTGYKKIGSYYYLFNSSGVMQTGTVTYDKKKYSLCTDGIAVLHTSKIKTALNYRTGPSTKYKRIGTYKKNKVVSIIRTQDGWGMMSNGYWIKLSYTSKQTTYPQKVSSSSSSASKSYKVKTTAALNYRTGPSTSYKRKGTYKKGTKLTIVSSKNGWGKMSNGYWVKLSYTKKV